MSENVTSKFRIDVSDLKRNIADASRQVKLYRAELENASAGMTKGEETAESLSKKIEAQSKIVEAEKKKLEALKAELTKYESKLSEGEGIITDLTKKHEEAAKAYGEDSKEARELAKQLAQAQAAQERNTRAAEELRVRIVQQDTAVRNAEGQVDRFSQSLDDLQKEEEQTGEAAQETTDGGIQAFAVALGNLAADVIEKCVEKLGDLAKSVIETGMAFDTSMSRVQAVSGATADEMDALEQKADALAASTKFNGQQIADAFSYMGMAGWKAQDMLGGIDGVLNLAAAGGSELATTSDIVTDSLTAFGESANEAGRLADVMAAAMANSNTNIEMMGETFKYAAPLAGAMGYSMEDVAIATGLMANSGIKATQAGTSLRSVFTRLSTEPKEAAEAMHVLGVSLDDGHGNMKSLMEVMQELRGSFGTLKISQAELERELNRLDSALESGEMSEKEFAEAQAVLMERAYGAEGAMKAQYASMLAGKNGLSGFLAIVNSSDKDFNDLTDAIYNSKDAATEMAATMIDNLEGDLTLLDSAFYNFKKVLYEAVESPLRNLVQMATKNIMPLLTDVVNGVEGAGDKLGAAISDVLTTALGYVTDALPGAIDIGLTLITAVGDAALNALPGLLQAILTAATSAFPKLTAFLLKAVQKLADFLTDNLDPLLYAAGDLAAAIISALLDPATLAGFVEAAGSIIAALADALSGDGMIHLLEAANGLAAALVRVLVSPEVLGKLAEAGTKILTAVVKALVVLTPALVRLLMELCESIAYQLYSADWAGIGMSIIESMLTGAESVDLTGIEQQWLAVADIIAGYLQQVGDVAAKIWGGIVRVWQQAAVFFRRVFTDAYDNIKSVFSSIGSFFSGIWERLRSTFSTIGTKIGQAVGGAFKSAINSVLATVERNLNFVPNAVNNLLDTINQIPGVNIGRMGGISLPRLAKGGIVDKATVAQIGEAGKEAIIPLERNKAGLRQIAGMLAEEMAAGGVRGMGGTVQAGTTVTLTQNITSPKALSQYDIWLQTKNLLQTVKLQGV